MAEKKYHYKTKKRTKGFSLVELVVAIGIFAIVASGVIYVVINSYRIYYGAGDRQVVIQFAQEGLEAVKSIRDNSWQGIVDASDSANHGVVKTNNLWGFSGTSNTLGALTRVIVIDDVNRDASGNIGGSIDDPNTKKVTVTVSGSGISNYVLVSFITNWSHRYWEQTDWSGVGASEFWNSATKASSSYSNINTSTPGALTLAFSAGGTPGSYGDWGNIYPIATSSYMRSNVNGIALSPDEMTLYVAGQTNTQDFRVYDISQARSGIIKEKWSVEYTNDVIFNGANSVVAHPGGRYVYLGTNDDYYGENLIMIVDTYTREINFSRGGRTQGASYTTLAINEMVIDGNFLYALGNDFRIYVYQITNDGANLTLYNGTNGQLMAPGAIYGGTVVGSYLYVVTGGATASFIKIDISNPAVLSTTTSGYNFASPGGSGRRHEIKYIGTVGGYPRFLVTGSNTSYEAEIIEDQGSSARTLAGLALAGGNHRDIVDGGLGQETYFLYEYDGNLIEVNASSTTGLLYTSSPNCNGRACKSANYPYSAYGTGNYFADGLVYSSVLGGLILTEYKSSAPASFALYFIPRDETRATGATYSYRRAITIDHTKVPNTDQSSFPILISGTYSYLKATSSGGNIQSIYGHDLIFTSDLAGDTLLDYEIESYTSSTGALTAWVRIPTLSYTSDTTIYMFYGNSNIRTSQERVSSVWDSSFKLVQHFNVLGTDAERYDSTTDQNGFYRYSGDASTVDVAVTASSDDAQEVVSSGAVTTNNGFLYLSYNSPDYYYTGLRFQNVKVPQGARILSSYIEFQASTTIASTASSTENVIAAEATDDATTFTTDNYNISSRATTTAYVTWRFPGSWTAGTLYRTIDISPVLTEVVNRPGWSSGNDIALRIKSNVTDRKIAKSYDNSIWTSTTSPRLHINYASSSGQMNSGDSFDNDNDKLYSYANYRSLWQNADDFTVEFWIKYAGNYPSYAYSCVLYKGNGDAGVQEGWFIRFLITGGQPKLTFHMGNNGKNLGGVTMTNALSVGSWDYIALVVDRDVGYQWYKNMATDNSYATDTSSYTALGTSTQLGISWDWWVASPTMSLLGNLDEIRISHTKRSVDWLTTSYNSQNSPSTFYSIDDDATSVSGYASPGTLYSSIIDLGASDQTLTSLSVNQNVPAGCSLVITLEGSNTAGFSSVASQDFSDSSTNFFTSSTPASLNDKKYLRYKTTLTNCNSGSSAPTLYSLRLNYR